MTAEESIKELVDIYGLNSTFQDEIKEKMIEFAQYHVEKALKEADGEAPLHCSEGILNCYPKENIK